MGKGELRNTLKARIGKIFSSRDNLPIRAVSAAVFAALASFLRGKGIADMGGMQAVDLKGMEVYVKAAN